MWDLPGPGVEPVSPALAGGSRFLTTVPPGKSQDIILLKESSGFNVRQIWIICLVIQYFSLEATLAGSLTSVRLVNVSEIGSSSVKGAQYFLPYKIPGKINQMMRLLSSCLLSSSSSFSPSPCIFFINTAPCSYPQRIPPPNHP